MTQRGLLLDLDGTLYNGDHMIEYADKLVARLREKGVPFLFLTNNSSRTPNVVAAHLCHLGIEAREEEVYNSAQAAAQYVRDNWNKTGQPRVYCIGETGIRTALAQNGVEFVADEAEPKSKPADYVVQGIDRQLTYDRLCRGVQHILAGATFVLTNPDLLLPWNREYVPGAGSIGALLEAATAVKPVIIGKPSAIILNYALHQLNRLYRPIDAIAAPLKMSDIWMLGDNLRTDIAAAANVGCRSALVLTGLAQPDNVDRLVAETGVRPDHIFTDLHDFTDKFLATMSQ
jgi:4-nitrophenyl phosphatase